VKVQVFWDMTPARKPEDINLYEHGRESLKSRTQSIIPLPSQFLESLNYVTRDFDLNLTFRVLWIRNRTPTATKKAYIHNVTSVFHHNSHL